MPSQSYMIFYFEEFFSLACLGEFSPHYSEHETHLAHSVEKR